MDAALGWIRSPLIPWRLTMPRPNRIVQSLTERQVDLLSTALFELQLRAEDSWRGVSGDSIAHWSGGTGGFQPPTQSELEELGDLLTAHLQ